MFEAYATRTDPLASRRFAASMGASVAFIALIAGLGAAIGGREIVKEIEKKVDVSFRPLPPPPPPPPPKIEAPKPKPPPQAKPPPPKSVTPPPAAPVAAAAPAAIIAPKDVPLERAPEADADQAVPALAMAVGGTGDGSGTGSADGVAGGTGTEVGAAVARPINLPENAVPPKPLGDNLDPEFPAEAKAAGKEGMVILKIVVTAEGRVGAVKVMRGDEPFVGAALKAVKTWRFEPALVDGQPTSVFRILKIPFRIRS